MSENVEGGGKQGFGLNLYRNFNIDLTLNRLKITLNQLRMRLMFLGSNG